MTDAPHIIICVPKAERPFGARVADLLKGRGLKVSLVESVTELQRAEMFAAICVVLASDRRFHAQDMALVDEAISAASTAQRPLFPLLLRGTLNDFPMLEKTQWSDFTGHFWSGWRDLLLALDAEKLSLWTPQQTLFDADVVIARAQNGLTPPDWQVYRGFARLSRSITVKTLRTCGLVIILSLVAGFLGRENWLEYLLVGGLFLLVMADVSRYRLWGYAKNGPIIVVTPDGFVNVATVGTDWFNFAKLRSIEVDDAKVVEGSKELTITQLHITRNTGERRVVDIPSVYDTKVTPLFNSVPRRSKAIADAIVAAFRRTQQPVSKVAYRGQSPGLFLSYAHHDEHVISVFEYSLRNLGMNPWVDRSRLKVGMRWEEEIEAAIKESEALVLFVSPASVASSYIDKEIDIALAYHKPIIGVIIDSTNAMKDSWRPYIKAEYRLKYGGLNDLYPFINALGKAGLMPEEMRTRREQGALFVIARAKAHAPLTDEQVFGGGRMSVVDTLTFLGVGVILAALALVFPTLLIYVYMASIVVALLWESQIPIRQELIVIFPTGIAHTLLGQLSATAFDPSDEWRITRSASDGTVIKLTEKRAIAIPSRFRNHRQIAQQMIAAFQQFKE